MTLVTQPACAHAISPVNSMTPLTYPPACRVGGPELQGTKFHHRDEPAKAVDFHLGVLAVNEPREIKHLDTQPGEWGRRWRGARKCHGPYLVHLCAYNTNRHNSTHPITMASLMQCVMPVMAGALIHKKSSLHLQQKVHTLLPPPAHSQPLTVSVTRSTLYECQGLL